MTEQKSRNNHYVPKWYQRGFLAAEQSRLFYLNLAPDLQSLPDGRKVPHTALRKRGIDSCFVEFDLYTTHFGPIVNDEVETRLFGNIDRRGAPAVRAFALGDHDDIHQSFEDFFEFMAAQKLRTPKGLDWIRSCYGELGQLDLMVEMQALRLMHCAMWTEGVREIVSAAHSDVKFVVTDHPVTVYNAAMPPSSPACAYPQDPMVAALGTQTVFALNADTCLIFTHLEYATQTDGHDLHRLRTNARQLGGGITRTDNFIRDRRLSRDDVIAINYLLKSRAKRYIAAADKAWLFPEQHFHGSWASIAQVLLPRGDLWNFGGEIYVGYADGTSGYWDAYGRTSKAHAFLTRKSPGATIQADDFCGCGSAYAYKDCCQPLGAAERPSWEIYGLRERNLMFCNAVQGILGLHDGASWEDVRRTLSDEQVQRIHGVFSVLWPEDTDLASLLPRPNRKVLRSVFMGFADPRTVEATVIGWLPYIDEIVLVNPFFLGTRMKAEFSPIESPGAYKMQTLKNVMLLLVLEPFIRAGLVHLVPDPCEVNATLGRHLREVLTRRVTDWTPADGGLDRVLKLGEAETRRYFWMLPEASQRSFIARNVPGADAATTDWLIAHYKSLAEADPYTLLQPLPAGKAGAQCQVFRGLNLESALYLASLTGSIIHVDTQAHWEQLLKDAQPPGASSLPAWEPVRQALGEISFPVEQDAYGVAERLDQGDCPPIRSLLRQLVDAVATPESGPAPAELAQQLLQSRAAVESTAQCADEGSVLSARLDLHVPPHGFSRHEVQRLLIMFAGATEPQAVPYALRLVFDEPRDVGEDAGPR